ncbi:crotonase/enoyl-CoA hydratase family protein [Sphingorhabdus contaminans]|uniref:Crotonase/enoyl-CoA hydratase family protein n=1 Tax=Sphingorhabdus contaminans TaxID=1343899 RepID=A0A553WCE3_9SPHN|nr:crotonase/enoyl-CoA hydratase family protein [Sphingorhabdus contaminans]
MFRSRKVSDRVELVVAEQVAEVRLNRPDKLNALDFPTFDLLIEVGQLLSEMPGLRAIILSGNGRSFSVGIDLAALAHDGASALSDLSARTHGEANRFQKVALQWRDLPVPVIAAIQGHALGGGMQLALGADIRIVAPDAQLSVREIVWGLIPDMAGTVLLRQLVRADVMRDLLYSGRIVTGEEALEIGLATRLADDPLATARELAREIAAYSPDAVRSAKRLANLGSAGTSDPNLLLAEAAEQQALLESYNHSEALKASMEKRAPIYRD